MPPSFPQPGSTFSGYIVRAIHPLPELNATLIQLKHQVTGARHVHIQTPDRNNLCAIGFRTPPADSSGVAHILEHTTLCGSRRFPVRDPFFAMIKRSLNTFMNAMTASDWTFYPFASQNPQDVRNLLSIYLDATFFPLLREEDFRQEGHRLEFTDPGDPATPLLRRGIVYNEMQGAMASPASLLSRRMSRALYPHTTYHFNSGGEPTDIPKLTWEDLRAFHDDFYHPSNAWFFTYGNLPLKGHLQQIQDEVLCHFEPRQVESAIPPETRLAAPRQVVEFYPVESEETAEKKTFVQVGWLTCDVVDSFERLALSLLSSLLIGNPAAPLYRALLESRLGENLAPGCGYHDDNRTTAFTVGLQGCSSASAAEVEPLILATLAEVAEQGFTPERIAGAIQRLEFEHREVTGNSYPYALSLLFRMLGPWLHNDDPLSGLQLGANLERLRKEIAAGPFLQNLIRHWFLDNPHRVTLTLTPDAGLRAREEAANVAELQRIKAGLPAPAVQALVTAAQQLQAEQEREQDLSSLPTLTRADIPRTEEVCAPVEGAVEQGVVHFVAPTNGIGYVAGHFAAERVPPALRPLLPLWCALLPQIGAAGSSYVQIAERIEAQTGGVSFSCEILDDLHSMQRFTPVVALRGKALLPLQEALYELLGDLCTSPDFSDLERLSTLLGQVQANLENSIVTSGHSYAARAAAAHLTAAARQREEWGGISLLQRVRSLAGSAETLSRFAGDLAAITAALVDASTLRLGVTAEAGKFAAIDGPLARFQQRLPLLPVRSSVPPLLSAQPVRLGWSFNTPVNFVAQVWTGVPLTHPDGAALSLLAKILRAAYLHREIREKGGAYGGMASYAAETGLFSCLSYRDPHLLRTLEVFVAAAEWGAKGGFSAVDLEEALLAVFADLDRPLSPGGRGAQEFANGQQGLTLEIRQESRDRLLTVTRSDLMRVAELYLLEGRSQSAISVIASEETLLSANAETKEGPFTLARI
ncbi:MAG: insulinase family protein [Desulfuromonadales bacterium]|nr:insulinase family protein [Desulfuromonadales bacterium]